MMSLFGEKKCWSIFPRVPLGSAISLTTRAEQCLGVGVGREGLKSHGDSTAKHENTIQVPDSHSKVFAEKTHQAGILMLSCKLFRGRGIKQTRILLVNIDAVAAT